MIKQIFQKLGAEFIISPEEITKRLNNIQILLFDWDGVFNGGSKYIFNNGKEVSFFSNFNEIDSMGINMLCFGFYLQHGKIPLTAIITGEKNEAVCRWAKREHLNFVFSSVKHKADILPFLNLRQTINPKEMMFCFDDIADISLARLVGLRWMIRRKSNPLFLNFCKKKKYCDYITGQQGNEYALREISEVSLSLLGCIEETFNKRIESSKDYKQYILEKHKIKTVFYTQA